MWWWKLIKSIVNCCLVKTSNINFNIHVKHLLLRGYDIISRGFTYLLRKSV